MANNENIDTPCGTDPGVSCPLVDALPPILPRPRMPLSQRAKIFVPFDPLKGYQDALREKEREAEEAHDERVRLNDAP